MSADRPLGTASALADPELLRRVNALRRTDNWRNLFYLAREGLFLTFVIALTIGFYRLRPTWQLGWAWNLPVTLLAILLVGIGQHRLLMLGHEASHYLLFRNRIANELASDWFCLFPLWSLTHNYRLQHLAHHHHVNDPDHDPDLVFMRAVGHCYRVLLPRWRFLKRCVGWRLLWIPGLVRYIRIRARYTATGSGSGPYQGRRPRSRLLIGVGIGYTVGLAGAMTALALWGNELLLALVPAGLYALVAGFYLAVPDRLYPRTLVRPDIPPRVYTLLRLAHVTLLFSALAWLGHRTGWPWGLYYIVLWIVPLVTVFSFLMILREDAQHGEGTDRGRFTSTRLFRGHPLVRWTVFPLGMDYHLPHHLFPLVPHYRLEQLHRLLLEVEEYRTQVRAVEAYLLPRHSPAG